MIEWNKLRINGVTRQNGSTDRQTRFVCPYIFNWKTTSLTGLTSCMKEERSRKKRRKEREVRGGEREKGMVQKKERCRGSWRENSKENKRWGKRGSEERKKRLKLDATTCPCVHRSVPCYFRMTNTAVFEYKKWHHKYRVDQKKVNFVLDQLETCSFLQGDQHVSNNTSIVKFDIAKFWLFLLYFMGIFGA